MKAVILSAGFGSRLRPVTRYIPKALLPVCGKRVIDRVISFISEKTKEIILVSGYLSEMLESYVKKRYPFIEIVKIDAIYSGNLYTLLSAKDYLLNSDFIIANADHIFEKKLWKFFPKNFNGIEIACHRKGIREIFEDEMKVVMNNGKFDFMDKKAKNYEGAYTGITFINKDISELYWKTAEKIFSEMKDKAKVEDVVNALKDYVNVVWIDEVKFWEVDSMEDLRRVWDECKSGNI